MLPSPATLPAMLSLLACQKSVTTPFPEGLEPLEDCAAGFPAQGDDGVVPVQAQVATGETEDWLYAHVCGYVGAGVEDAWLAIQDADVVTDRRRITEYAVTAQDIEPEYEVSFRIHHLVEDLITVEYDIDWRQGVWEEDDDGVQSVAARFQKTEGSSFIELIEGSLVLEAVDDQEDRTAFSLVIHHASLGYKVEELELKATDLYDSVAAVAAGQPLPTYAD
ncbi:hypothetical protein L6R53_02835 [Myxococcota bacterium]|nr:hypothetical protein [Myxococcota bacterium]